VSGEVRGSKDTGLPRKISVRDHMTTTPKNRRRKSCVILEQPVWEIWGNIIQDNCPNNSNTFCLAP